MENSELKFGKVRKDNIGIGDSLVREDRRVKIPDEALESTPEANSETPCHLDLFTYEGGFEGLVERMKDVSMDELVYGYTLINGEFRDMLTKKKMGIISEDEYYSRREKYNDALTDMMRLINLKKNKQKHSNNQSVNVEYKAAMDLKTLDDLEKAKSKSLQELNYLVRVRKETISKELYKEELLEINNRAMYLQRRISVLKENLESKNILKKKVDIGGFKQIGDLIKTV